MSKKESYGNMQSKSLEKNTVRFSMAPYTFPCDVDLLHVKEIGRPKAK